MSLHSFIFAVPMRKCWGLNSCTSYTFALAMLHDMVLAFALLAFFHEAKKSLVYQKLTIIIIIEVNLV